MKFNKIYHALTADPKNKWKESFRETVDIDPAQAEDENLRFELTGVKYVAIEAHDLGTEKASTKKAKTEATQPEAAQEPATSADAV
jgi:hypothetical protein